MESRKCKVRHQAAFLVFQEIFHLIIRSSRTINFSRRYRASGNSYLSVDGCTTNPLVENYIIEDFDTYDPSSGTTILGIVTSDGSSYDIFKATRTNVPSNTSTATFTQYWSVRESKRTSVTVMIANYFHAWVKFGMQLGILNYQIVATEGRGSSGKVTILLTPRLIESRVPGATGSE